MCLCSQSLLQILFRNTVQIKTEAARMVQCKQGEQQDAKLDGTNRKSTEVNLASWGTIVGNLISIILFFGDTGSDIFIASVHYRSGNYWHFGLTVAFIVVPAIVTDVFSTIWYIEDSREHRVSALRWTVRIVFLVLQLAPVLRYVDSLIYGLKSLRGRKQSYHQRMINEYCDAAYLKLFEAFMEAAPQLVLQIYILAKQYSLLSSKLTVIHQGVTISLSWISLSLALAFYHRALRLSVLEKSKISWTGTIVQTFWHFFVIGARVLCLALLALLSPVSLALFCLVHWGMMFTWIIIMKTGFCKTRFQEIMYNAVLAVVFIFNYLNPVDEPTRYKYTLYYGVTLIQNTIIIGIWCHYCSSSLLWLRLPAILFHYLSFSAGITIMISYYLFLHPSGGIKVFGGSTMSKNGAGGKQMQQCESRC